MRMKRRIRTDVCLILCGILVWFLADARQLRLEAAKALTLCAGTVIPALFPFMVVTGLLVRLGFGQWLAPDMAGLMASLFRLPGCAGSALLLWLYMTGQVLIMGAEYNGSRLAYRENKTIHPPEGEKGTK